MTDISAYQFDSVDSQSRPQQDTLVTTLLSLLLITGFPACFWLSLLELANYVLSLGISNATRLAVAGTLIGLLSMIWGIIVISASRRRRTWEVRDPE